MAQVSQPSDYFARTLTANPMSPLPLLVNLKKEFQFNPLPSNIADRRRITECRIQWVIEYSIVESFQLFQTVASFFFI